MKPDRLCANHIRTRQAGFLVTSLPILEMREAGDVGRKEGKRVQITTPGQGGWLVGTPRGRKLAGLAIATVLVSATILVVRATMINRELRATLLSQNAMASRTAVHDRLIGRRIPLTLLGKTALPDSGSDGPYACLTPDCDSRSQHCCLDDPGN